MSLPTPDPTLAKLIRALAVARDNRTAIVITPNRAMLRLCLNTLIHQLDATEAWKAQFTADTLHYAERGSVRFFTADHVEWDANAQRLRSYPHGVPVFVIESPPDEAPEGEQHGEA